jgi:hypothetical protein
MSRQLVSSVAYRLIVHRHFIQLITHHTQCIYRLELKSSISSCQSEWGVFDEKRDSNVAYLFDHVVFNPELLGESDK